MTCKSKKCESYRDFKGWEADIDKMNTDDMLSMPDNCSRCKRAYPDMFHRKQEVNL